MSTTVASAPNRAHGFVNAVLRGIDAPVERSRHVATHLSCPTGSLQGVRGAPRRRRPCRARAHERTSAVWERHRLCAGPGADGGRRSHRRGARQTGGRPVRRAERPRSSDAPVPPWSLSITVCTACSSWWRTVTASASVTVRGGGGRTRRQRAAAEGTGVWCRVLHRPLAVLSSSGGCAGGPTHTGGNSGSRHRGSQRHCRTRSARRAAWRGRGPP